MAKIIDNPAGRRMIKLSPDDVMMIVSMFQRRCGSKAHTCEEARRVLGLDRIYLPEDI